MNKKIARRVFCSMLLAFSITVLAQQAHKVARIGILFSASPSSASANADALRRALPDLGYLEGRNIAIEYRYAEEQQDRLPELAAQLIGAKVDVLIADGGTM